jgi:hypothetical protein
LPPELLVHDLDRYVGYGISRLIYDDAGYLGSQIALSQQQTNENG